MATQLVSIEEYLRTAFDGLDREYVDGRIVVRNGGERPHSFAQGEVLFFFRSMGRRNVFPYPSQRVQVKPRRFRIPDVCVYVGSDPQDGIFHSRRGFVYTSDGREEVSGDLWTLDPEFKLALARLF